MSFRKKLLNMEDAKILATQGLEPNGGALGSKDVSKLGKLCHCEDERSEDVALYQYPASYGSQVRLRCKPIAKSLNIDEITTSHFTNAPRNDKSPSEASEMNLTTYRPNDLTSFLKPSQPSLRKGRRIAFTLAEVLITLGIIGVVSALTLPSVVNNIKHKQLETGFKTAYSIFSQAVQNMKREDGEGIAKYYAYYDADKGIIPNAGEFEEKFYKYSGLKVIGKCDYKKVPVMNYTNTAEAQSYAIHSSSKDGANYVDLKDELSNGMCSVFTATASTLFFVVDTNGIKKPNKLGHDVFWFKINNNDMLEPVKMRKLYTDDELENVEWGYVAGDPCSTKSKQAGNGTGCGYYAMINQNPDDPTKGYWESLP